MTFFVQRSTGHELMPLGKVFKGAAVKKTDLIDAIHGLDETEHRNDPVKHGQQRDAAQAYQSVKQVPGAHRITGRADHDLAGGGVGISMHNRRGIDVVSDRPVSSSARSFISECVGWYCFSA